MRKQYVFSVMVSMILLIVTNQLSARTGTAIGEIKKNLICMCECQMTIDACEGSMACQSADKITAEARTLIQQGLNKDQILAGFVTRYGEHVLSAPIKKGFNLIAWLLPFIAILFTGFLIIKLLRRWVHHPQKRTVNPTVNDNVHFEYADNKKIDDALRALD